MKLTLANKSVTEIQEIIKTYPYWMTTRSDFDDDCVVIESKDLKVKAGHSERNLEITSDEPNRTFIIFNNEISCLIGAGKDAGLTLFDTETLVPISENQFTALSCLFKNDHN